MHPPQSTVPATGAARSGPARIVLVRPRGFCAGVDRAIAIVERALEKFGAPVYVKHAIVHNRHVVERLQALGAVFVEDLQQVPAGARVIFSAHGVAPELHDEARLAGLTVLDATCPLVTKVHVEARRFAGENRTIFLVGHAEHIEVIGTRGEAPDRIVVIGSVEEAQRVQVPDAARVAYLTQTTLSLDDTRAIVAVLRRRFPALKGPNKDDICYATQNRQNAVHALAREADVILVVGSAHSSNSNRLVEVAHARGVPAYLLESHLDLQPDWLQGRSCVGITAGASAPEEIVQALVRHIARTYGAAVEERDVVPEDVSFPLPSVLTG
jgi:4-hydroxy-3-methylbut-2-en-1-yl diphosphate reductase